MVDEGCAVSLQKDPRIVTFDRQFVREAERRRTAVPDPLTGALPGPNDYSDLAFETHGSTPRNRCSRMLYGASLRKSARASRIEGGRQILANRDYSTDKRHPVVFP